MAGLSVLAVFSPIEAVIMSVFALVAADFITGVWASKKKGKKITSGGFKRTVGKLFLYEIAICAAFLVQTYLTGDLLPALKLVSALIGLTELKSVLENLDAINGDSFFNSILNRVAQSEKEIDTKDGDK